MRRWESDTILCVANLSRHAQPVELDLSEFKGLTPVEMLGYTPFPAVGEQPYFLTLGGYGFYWFELRRDGLIRRGRTGRRARPASPPARR